MADEIEADDSRPCCQNCWADIDDCECVAGAIRAELVIAERDLGGAQREIAALRAALAEEKRAHEETRALLNAEYDVRLKSDAAWAKAREDAEKSAADLTELHNSLDYLLARFDDVIKAHAGGIGVRDEGNTTIIELPSLPWSAAVAAVINHLESGASVIKESLKTAERRAEGAESRAVCLEGERDGWQRSAEIATKRAEEAERERDEEQAKRLESQVQAMTLLAERNALASRLAEERRYLREAFSAGAAWWEEHSTGGTMWQSDRHLVDDEAERRYVNGEWVTGPLVNRLEACLLATEKKLAEAVGVLRRATDLLSSVKHHLRSDDPARAAVESFLASLAPETKGGKV